MKAMGVAEHTQRKAMAMDKFSAFLELYPPRAVVTLPPITTPRTGPVILTIANVTKTVSYLTFNSLIR